MCLLGLSRASYYVPMGKVSNLNLKVEIVELTQSIAAS
jgi:hypothetical protein